MAIWIAAVLIVGAVALFIAAPLTDGLVERRNAAANVEMGRREHQRALAVQALRELEFDHEMGKLGDEDYRSLRERLEIRALTAMDRLEEARRPSLSLASSGRIGAAAGSSHLSAPARAIPVNFCPQCGTRIGLAHNFCANCGAALAGGSRAPT